MIISVGVVDLGYEVSSVFIEGFLNIDTGILMPAMVYENSGRTGMRGILYLAW